MYVLILKIVELSDTMSEQSTNQEVDTYIRVCMVRTHHPSIEYNVRTGSFRG